MSIAYQLHPFADPEEGRKSVRGQKNPAEFLCDPFRRLRGLTAKEFAETVHAAFNSDDFEVGLRPDGKPGEPLQRMKLSELPEDCVYSGRSVGLNGVNVVFDPPKREI